MNTDDHTASGVRDFAVMAGILTVLAVIVRFCPVDAGLSNLYAALAVVYAVAASAWSIRGDGPGVWTRFAAMALFCLTAIMSALPIAFRVGLMLAALPS